MIPWHVFCLGDFIFIFKETPDDTHRALSLATITLFTIYSSLDVLHYIPAVL